MDVLIIFGLIANIVGIIGGIFAILAWYQAKRIRVEAQKERERLAQRIQVALKLTDGSRQITLPVELRRAELSRAELLGRLGMIPMKDRGRRFSLDYLNTKEFLQEIDRIHGASGEHTLIIPCTEDELNQFAINQTTLH